MYRIVSPSRSHQEIPRSVQLAALEEHLPDAEIVQICRDIRHTWRNRKLPPGATVRSMVYRALNPDRSIAAVLADLAALAGADAEAPTDAAWCQARARLPEAVLVELIRRNARRARRRFGPDYRWHDRWVFIVDGSTISMPDEPSLVRAFGYASTRHGPSRFPVARVTFIEVAGVAAIWDYRLDEYRCHEDSQFHGMWQGLPSGCICLCDRKFCTFYNLAKLRRRRIGVIAPLYQRRDPRRLIRHGYPLGINEWAVPLRLAPQLRRHYQDPSLPETLWVRLILVGFGRGVTRHVLWLVTTLMNPIEYPRREVAELYRQRGDIEPRIGSLKTTLEMDVLRGKSPNAVRREVAATILGHNLVWMLIHEAAEQSDTCAQDISFAGAVKTVLAFSTALCHAPCRERRRLRQLMLEHIARHTNHHPFGRVEPRRVKRDPVRYPFLREPRWKARLKCLS